MALFTRWLFNKRTEDTRVAATLTVLELPNLMAMLELLRDTWKPDDLVDLADSVESLVARLGHPRALARATKIRSEAASKLGAWSHAHFVTAAADITRLTESGKADAAATAEASLDLLNRAI